MKKISFFILAGLLLNISLCRAEAEFMNIRGLIFGSTYSIIYENSKQITPVELKQEVEKKLLNFRYSISSYIDTSLMSRINRNEDVKIDAIIEEAYNMAVMISEMSSGAFDITVGPLVRTWGFGADRQRSFDEQQLDSLLNLVGMDKIKLVDGRFVKSNPNIVLDFNAISKGFSVDLVARYFNNLGIENYLIEIGGEARAKGTRNGNLWRMGIDRPDDSNIRQGRLPLQAILSVTDKSMATSGDYRRFYIEDGVKYSHTIDPKTGYPIKNRLLSVTAFADDCAIADGIATACMVMGHERAIEFINSHPQFSAYMIYSTLDGGFETWMSESLREYIEEF
jgi:thiamine biosynthesis lipoprotein